jgi:signal transduction histidine kinase
MKLGNSASFRTELTAIRSLIGGRAGADELRLQADLLQLFLRQWPSALIALLVLTAAVFVVGRSYAPEERCIAWAILAMANALAQIGICRVMDTCEPRAALQRLHGWLLLSVGFNGVIWGALPLVLVQSTTSVVVSACLFNAMVLFCVCNAPGTLAMRWVAVPPITILGGLALVLHRAPYLAVAHVALCALIRHHGMQIHRLLKDGLAQRNKAERLADELRMQQAQLIEAEHGRRLLLERQRLTRDIHDGIGSTLVALLAAAERSEVRDSRLVSILQDCVEDFRAVIESLNGYDRDVEVLLATVRPRFERQLQAAGIQLQWQMDDLPHLSWLGPSEVLQVMRMTQELIANVIKHASATSVHLHIKNSNQFVEVCIADDGCGFNAQAPQHTGQGLRSLHERALGLHGELTFVSAPGRGTTAVLRLPVERSH